jgi:hypothetical protein
MIPVAVPETAKQGGEAWPFDWVERSIWTDRMLEALDEGVKGARVPRVSVAIWIIYAGQINSFENMGFSVLWMPI